MSKGQAKERALELLRELELPATDHIVKQYQFQLSGG